MPCRVSCKLLLSSRLCTLDRKQRLSIWRVVSSLQASTEGKVSRLAHSTARAGTTEGRASTSRSRRGIDQATHERSLPGSHGGRQSCGRELAERRRYTRRLYQANTCAWTRRFAVGAGRAPDCTRRDRRGQDAPGERGEWNSTRRRDASAGSVFRRGDVAATDKSRKVVYPLRYHI